MHHAQQPTHQTLKTIIVAAAAALANEAPNAISHRRCRRGPEELGQGLPLSTSALQEDLALVRAAHLQAGLDGLVGLLQRELLPRSSVLWYWHHHACPCMQCFGSDYALKTRLLQGMLV